MKKIQSQMMKRISAAQLTISNDASMTYIPNHSLPVDVQNRMQKFSVYRFHTIKSSAILFMSNHSMEAVFYEKGQFWTTPSPENRDAMIDGEISSLTSLACCAGLAIGTGIAFFTTPKSSI